VVKSEVHKCI